MPFLPFFPYLTRPDAVFFPKSPCQSSIGRFYPHTGVSLPQHTKSEALRLGLATIPGNTSLNYSDVQVWFKPWTVGNHKFTLKKEEKTRKINGNKRNIKGNKNCVKSPCISLQRQLTSMRKLGTGRVIVEINSFSCVTCIKLSNHSEPQFTCLMMSVIMMPAVTWGFNYIFAGICWQIDIKQLFELLLSQAAQRPRLKVK